ncbi:Fic family protein [Methanimicrococcus sp. OttesenSCG-928-J09]|nr:Fic family protein [Methanimicrococcus sp. OttesenSCG-928-J09]
MTQYIYQEKKWPKFSWDDRELVPLLGNARNMQGRLIGKMEAIGFPLGEEAVIGIMTADAIKSSEIEGEKLNREQVRSSVARHLGIEIPDMIPSDRNTDGVVEMLIDASQRYAEPLTKERLWDWHLSLFAEKPSWKKITVGNWRTDENGPMQVVSGPIGKETVHYQAPAASEISSEMEMFLEWLNEENQEDETDSVIKAGIAHLWFLTIHPFDDGNGRIARAVTDMMLARSDKSPFRYYSMSVQIQIDRNAYYEILEKTQKGTLDITEWLKWFLICLERAIAATEDILKSVFRKYDFWKKYDGIALNDRQKYMITKLLNDFEGKLKSSKWAKMTKCSQDTALRDITDLMEKGILKKEEGGGRSTNYELADF